MGGSTMSRLFGRTAAAAPAQPPAAAAQTAAPWWAGGPGPAPMPTAGTAGRGAPPPAGAGVPYPPMAPGDRFAGQDPPTDPYGFAPVPAAAPTGPDHAEAAALAAAFAVDYLSWDEDDPGRRGRVLSDYLAVPGDDPDRLGWSGRGRQRAEFALPGLVRPDGDRRVLVDVRVRVTPYREVGERTGRVAEPDPAVPGVAAAAPAPTARGWRSLASQWIRVSVPVAVEGGRAVVDAWEEALGADEPAPQPRPADDATLHLDDPLVEPVAIRPGGAW